MTPPKYIILGVFAAFLLALTGYSLIPKFLPSPQASSPLTANVDIGPWPAKKSAPIEKISDPNDVFGYVTTRYQKNGRYYISFDLAELYSGELANQKAFEDGVCASPNVSCLPNPGYIRNNSTQLSTYEILPSATIDILTDNGQSPPTRITIPQFIKLNRALTPTQDLFEVHLQIKNNKIVGIQEQMLP